MLRNHTRRSILALALAFALPLAHAQSVGSAFTYQGELRASGSAANAAYDFQFRLYNSAGGSTQLGAQVTANAVTVTNGLFSVPLDFGPAQFAGDAQWLEISVRPAGSGTFETLSPRTAVTATPYALGAVAALANSVTTTSIVDGAVQFSDVNAAQFQARVTGTCAGSQGIQSIGASGTVVCGTFGAGTITGVTAGTGLTGGGTSGAVTLGIANSGVGTAQINPDQVQRRVTGNCPSGQYVRIVNQDGTVVCGTDAGGAAGWGLTGNAGTNAATNFIGTSDGQPLVLRAENVERARFGGAGLGINGAPFDSSVELSVRSAGDNQGNIDVFANLLLEPQSGVSPRAGILVSAGGGTSGNNNQGFFLDHYDASQAQIRRLSITGNGSTLLNDRVSGLGSSGNNQFIVGAEGGVGINTNHYLDVPEFLTMHIAPRPGSSRANMWLSGRNSVTDAPTNSGILLSANGTAGQASANFYVDAFATLPASPFEASRRLMSLESNGSGVFGGLNSNIFGNAGTNSVMLGGTGHTAAGTNAIVAGGERNSAAGTLSFAGGFRAEVRAQDPGAFVWADQVIDAPFTSNAANSFAVRSTGGARFVTAVGIGGVPSNGVRIGANEGAWSSLSDRAVKTAIERIDVGQVLEQLIDVPITSWSYIGAEDAVRHIGPMAQDFFASFGLGDSERHISTIDADGIALAAIQGLNAKLEAENAELRNRSASLEELTRQLLDRVSALEAGAAAPR